MENYEHCCDLMTFMLDDPRVPIFYIDVFRTYSIFEFETSKKFEKCLIPKSPWHFGEVLDFCPWCGSKLPGSLRDEWEKRLDQFREFDEDLLFICAPEEYYSDEWWKKAGL